MRSPGKHIQQSIKFASAANKVIILMLFFSRIGKNRINYYVDCWYNHFENKYLLYSEILQILNYIY